MKLYKLITGLFIFIISLASCTNNSDFLIEKGRVGEITKNTTVKELSSIFSKDSLVVKLSEVKIGEDQNKYFHDDDEYLVYNKEVKHLLTIIPINQQDSLSTLKSIEI